MSSGTHSLQAEIASSIQAWMLRHALLPPDRAAAIAPLIATFSHACSPHERDLDAAELRGYRVAAMFLALFWCLDHLEVQHAAGRDTIDRLESMLGAVQERGRAADRDPWVQALSELLDVMTGTGRRDVTVFAAAFADHLDAVEEKAQARMSANTAAGAPGAAESCGRIDDFLRLRPLLVATEPYLRSWQTVLGCWPGPAFARAVASLEPDLRRAHPSALLDRALDRARLASARGRGLEERRRSPALSELEALTVTLTYLANDLASVDRDRRAGGPEQEPNLALHLERYFRARIQERICPCSWDHGIEPAPPAAQAGTMVVDMYNAGAARLRTLRHRLEHEQEHDARRYLSLIIRIVDGNVQSTLAHAGARARADLASASASDGQANEPRYSSVSTLERLHLVDDASEPPDIASDGV